MWSPRIFSRDKFKKGVIQLLEKIEDVGYLLLDKEILQLEKQETDPVSSHYTSFDSYLGLYTWN